MKKFRKILSVVSAAIICTLPVANGLTSYAASSQGTRQCLIEIAEQELARDETSGQRYGTSEAATYSCDSSGDVQVDTCTGTPNTVTYNMSSMDEGIWFQTANQKGKTYKYVIEITHKDGSKARFEKSFKTV